MTASKLLAACTLLSAAISTVLLTGCALNNTAAPASVRGSALSGVAFGGQQPIVTAKVYLLAANPVANNASLSLLTTAGTGNAVDSIGAYTLTTSTTGQFALAGEYDCTKGYALGAATTGTPTTLSGSEQVYLYILGGNAGSGTNANIGLLAALGPCNAPYTTTLAVNELTTVAAAYAFAGYATDATHISSSGSALALQGLINAGLNSANLVSVATGLPVASSAGIIRPVATLYTLADILAACVNGSTANSNCGTLFQYTKSAGVTGAAPTDTATAAINLAHNPYPDPSGHGMNALYGLVPGTGAPYIGGLPGQPGDFTVGLTYTGGGLNEPQSIAIDASGNAWTDNQGNNSVSEFSSTGAAISPTTGYTGGGLNYPLGIAIDGSGNAWITNYEGFTVSEFSSTGTAISTSAGYTGGGLSLPTGIAIDAYGNAWIANPGTYTLSEFSSTGTAISTSAGYTGGGINAPRAVAIDASGNAWTANSNNSVSKFSSTGTAISGSGGYYGGGLMQDSGSSAIAIDGSGTAWIANYGGSSVSRFSSTGTAISPEDGYDYLGMGEPDSVAIDGSGDVWTAGFGSNIVTELIGAATPVVTPLVANLISPYSAPASQP